MVTKKSPKSFICDSRLPPPPPPPLVSRQGIRVQGAAFRVQSSGLRIQGSGSRVQRMSPKSFIRDSRLPPPPPPPPVFYERGTPVIYRASVSLRTYRSSLARHRTHIVRTKHILLSPKSFIRYYRLPSAPPPQPVSHQTKSDAVIPKPETPHS